MKKPSVSQEELAVSLLTKQLGNISFDETGMVSAVIDTVDPATKIQNNQAIEIAKVYEEVK